MPPDRIDPGLPAERTQLSWSRTALAVAGNGGLLLHSGVAGQSLLDYVPAILVLLCAVAFWACGFVRYRSVYAAVLAGRRVSDQRTVRVAALLAVIPGLVALVYFSL